MVNRLVELVILVFLDRLGRGGSWWYKGNGKDSGIKSKIWLYIRGVNSNIMIYLFQIPSLPSHLRLFNEAVISGFSIERGFRGSKLLFNFNTTVWDLLLLSEINIPNCATLTYKQETILKSIFKQQFHTGIYVEHQGRYVKLPLRDIPRRLATAPRLETIIQGAIYHN
jgi:hypothetical protein